MTELQRNQSVCRIHTIKHQALRLTATNRTGEKVQNTQCNSCEHVESKSWFQDCFTQCNYRLLPYVSCQYLLGKTWDILEPNERLLVSTNLQRINSPLWLSWALFTLEAKLYVYTDGVTAMKGVPVLLKAHVFRQPIKARGIPDKSI